jgi:hypothetical protein
VSKGLGRLFFRSPVARLSDGFNQGFKHYCPAAKGSQSFAESCFKQL